MELKHLLDKSVWSSAADFDYFSRVPPELFDPAINKKYPTLSHFTAGKSDEVVSLLLGGLGFSGRTKLPLKIVEEDKAIDELMGSSGKLYVDRASSRDSTVYLKTTWKFKKQNTFFELQPWNFKYALTSKDFLMKRERKDFTKFYGMEIEVSSSHSLAHIQTLVTQVEPKQKPFFYFVYDSSISGAGPHYYEIVTLPAEKDFLLDNFSILFDKIERHNSLARKLDLPQITFSDVAINNGIHVHINKAAFGDNRLSKTKAHRAKFLAAFGSGDPYMVKLNQEVSRRPYSFPAGKYTSLPHTHEELNMKQCLKFDSISYKNDTENFGLQRPVVHTINSKTVEVRLFQSGMTMKRIAECLEYVDLIFEATAVAPISSLSNFPKFLFDFVPSSNPLKEMIRKCA